MERFKAPKVANTYTLMAGAATERNGQNWITNFAEQK